MNPLYLNVSFAMCFLSTFFYASALFYKGKVLTLLARISTFAVIAGLSIYVGMRWQIAHRPPMSDMFESLVVFALAIAIGVVCVDLKYRVKSVPPFIALMSLLSLGYASLLDKEVVPLLPALKSNWLTIHVLTCFVGYAALTVAFISSIVLVARKNDDAQSSTVKKLDEVSYNSVSFGFLFLTLGIITGAVWANSAWGTYWSWDPKETWSLITWVIYAIYLHARFRKGWRGRKAAWLSVIGFLSMLFTYFGVNYLLSGLHSYG